MDGELPARVQWVACRAFTGLRALRTFPTTDGLRAPYAPCCLPFCSTEPSSCFRLPDRAHSPGKPSSFMSANSDSWAVEYAFQDVASQTSTRFIAPTTTHSLSSAA